ncbi:MAG: hypothetical protein KDC84_13550 [Crocinitomicaceae bacterium]|nr:hypothetical protein [Crocinitomicaceae bacterium]
MGLNYHKAIYTLIIHQDRLEQFRNPNNELVIQLLRKWNAYLTDPDYPSYPDTKEMASSLGMERQKVNVQIKDLYKRVISSFSDDPLIIKDYVHVIYIHIPYDEERGIKNKDYLSTLGERSLWFETKLPFLPRIGESISLDFIDDPLKFNRGYVNEIRYEIEGHTQRVIIYVHPFNDFYHQWRKMKDKHEWRLRMERQRDIR